jgi:hypothetical protein
MEDAMTAQLKAASNRCVRTAWVPFGRQALLSHPTRTRTVHSKPADATRSPGSVKSLEAQLAQMQSGPALAGSGAAAVGLGRTVASHHRSSTSEFPHQSCEHTYSLPLFLKRRCDRTLNPPTPPLASPRWQRRQRWTRRTSSERAADAAGAQLNGADCGMWKSAE